MAFENIIQNIFVIHDSLKLQIRKKETLNFYPKKMIDKYKSSYNKGNMQCINQTTPCLYYRYTTNDSLKRENNWIRFKEKFRSIIKESSITFSSIMIGVNIDINP